MNLRFASFPNRSRPCAGALRFLAVTLAVLCAAALRPTPLYAAEPAPSIGISALTNGPVRPNAWTVVTLQVSNPSDQALQAEAVTSFTTDANVQFARHVWLPPHAALGLYAPVRMSGPSAKSDTVELRARLLDTDSSPERRLDRPDQGENIALASLFAEPMQTALLDDGQGQQVAQAVSALRKSAGLPPRKFSLNVRQFPPSAAALDGYSVLVLAANARDFTARHAQVIHDWVLGGGHLWVMADRVDPTTLKMVLGPDWSGECAGETQLTAVTRAYPKRAEPTAEFDAPVRMIRYLNDPGMQVLQTANGWPSIMSKTAGAGQIVVTTLDASALWSPAPNDLPGEIQSLATQLFAQRSPVAAPSPVPGPSSGSGPVTPETAMHEFAAGSVGHQTVPRLPILAVLGGFCSALALAGWWLARGRRLEFIAPVGLALTIAATGGLVLLGQANRGQTPLTVAGMQEAHVAATGSRALYSGVVDVYSPSSFEGALAAPGGTLLWPEVSRQSGHVIRLQWSELDPTTWQHLQFPSAFLRASVRGAMPLPQAMEARGTFGPEGLQGRIEGLTPADLVDPLIITANGRLTLRSRAATGFAAGTDEELERGDYFGSGSVSPDRARRVETMRTLIEAAGQPASPPVYAWMHALDPGITVTSQASTSPQRRAWTLTAIPLTLERPVPGRTFIIPPAFMKMTAQRRSDTPTRGGLLFFDPRNGTFIGRIANASAGYLRFELPPVVLPAHIDSYHLRIDLSAPGRRVIVTVLENGGTAVSHPRVLADVQGPSTGLSLDIPADAKLQPDSAGGLALGLDVSANPDPTSTWEITAMRLSAQGRTEPGAAIH
jgi:hypothetical protein